MFNKLTDFQKSALIDHEAIYALARQEWNVTNSRFARRAVGLLNSTVDDQSAINEIYNYLRMLRPSQWPFRSGVESSPESPYRGFAAIAYNIYSGLVSWSWNYPSAAEAVASTLTRCSGGGCTTVDSMGRRCVAFAVENSQYQRASGGAANTRIGAENEALKSCSYIIGLPCVLVASVCNGY